MEEGTYRALRALGRGPLAPTAWVSAANEAPAVLKEVRRSYPQWFSETEAAVGLTPKGMHALARELIERTAIDDAPDDAIELRFRKIAEQRKPLKRELDQVWATEETVLRRARLLIARGDANRGLAFLGDDDLTAIALALQIDRSATVLEIDPDLIALHRLASQTEALDLRVHDHDLRQPIPPKLRAKFGAVFTDPPYAIEGFRLFVSRAIDLTRPDGRIWIAFGESRRATERGLEKQRALLEAGLFVEEVLPDFNRYHGAQSIGSSSSLYLCRRTPKTRPLVEGSTEGEIYSRRPPKSPLPR